jgi:spore maturation protein CgeB
VNDGREMKATIEHLLGDELACRQISESGLQTIRERHTCAHRARQLISIVEEIAR